MWGLGNRINVGYEKCSGDRKVRSLRPIQDSEDEHLGLRMDPQVAHLLSSHPPQHSPGGGTGAQHLPAEPHRLQPLR